MKSLHIAATIGSALLITMLSTTNVAAATLKAGTCGTDVTCVKTAGDVEINRRVTDLNLFITRTNANTYITAAEKTALVGDAQTNITNIQALKTTLDGETDTTKARADFKNIYAGFRIYVIVLPRDYARKWQDHLSIIQAKESGGIPTIQQAIANAPAGSDLTLINKQFADYQSVVADAATQLLNTQTGLNGLTPAAYNANPSATDDVRHSAMDDLHKADKDVKEAALDLRLITAELGGDKVANPAPTPTA